MGRVIDIDTHVDPKVEILYEYADQALRARWSDMTPYINARDTEGATRSTFRVNPIPFARQLRTSGSSGEARPGGKGALDNRTVARGEGTPSRGVTDSDSTSRLRDMDDEGVDVHLIIPGTWALASSALDTGIAKGLYSAYHRYATDYCAADFARLKSLALAPAADPAWSAAQIRSLQDEPWLSGVMVVLPEGTAIDDPALDPIWDATTEAELPLVYHSFFFEPPYFPGYRDMWGNLAVARTAAHPWGAQRIVATMILSGMFDQWPSLRIGFSETGAGWLPYWLLRLNMMAEYLPSAVVATKHRPLDYARRGNIFCGIQLYEGAQMAKAVIDIVGDDVLMYQSDYPHGECEWPKSVERARSWKSTIGEEAMTKMLGANAERFLRLL